MLNEMNFRSSMYAVVPKKRDAIVASRLTPERLNGGDRIPRHHTRASPKDFIAMTCPLCHIANLVSISMNVNQRQLELHSCGRCEMRWWKADGDQVGLSDVLNAARKTA